MDWSDLGRNAMGVFHTAGGTILRAYGAGSAVDSITKAEADAGLLPDWAEGGKKAPSSVAAPVVVQAPDYILLQHATGKSEVVQTPVAVRVIGGSRIPGTGYTRGDTSKFTFGVATPASVDVVDATGTKTFTDITRILFLGGTEGQTRVGDHMAHMKDHKYADLHGDGSMPYEHEGTPVGPSPSDVMMGFDILDGLAAVFTGGGSLVPSLTREAYVQATRTDTRNKGASSGIDPRLTAQQARLAAAQAAQQAAAGKTAGQMAQSTFVAPTAPHLDLTLDGGSMDATIAGAVEDLLGGSSDNKNHLTDVVRQVQWFLTNTQNGWFYPGKTDGIYGPKTAAAVMAYNASIGHPEDGGNITDNTMFAMMQTPLYQAMLQAQGGQAAQTSVAADYVLGCDLMGALPPSRPRPQAPKSTPAKSRPSPHKVAIEHAQRVSALAHGASKQAAHAAVNYAVKPHSTVLPMSKTVVRGETVLGVARTLTAAQKKAVQKHVDAMAKAKAVSIDADKKAKRAEALAQKLDGTIQKHTGVYRKIASVVSPHQRVGTKTGVYGDDILGGENADLVGDLPWEEPFALEEGPGSGPWAHVEITGDEGVGDDLDCLGAFMPEDLDRLNILGDASLHTYGGLQHVLGDVMQSPTDNFNILGGVDDTQTGDGSDSYVPPVRGQALSQTDAQVTWHHVPDDGVRYDGSQGFPNLSVGSYSWFADGNWPANKGAGGNKTGFIYTQRGTHFGRDQDQPRWMGQRNEDQVNDADDNDLAGSNPNVQKIAAASARLGMGPLIGNPQGPLAGLQYATDDDVWFWQADNAPAWATVEGDKQLQATWQQTQDAAAAAVAADSARQTQEQADREEAQTKQDAAIALAQTAADAQSAIAAQQLADQQAVVDAQSATAQTKLDIQQAQADQKLQAARDAYLIAHPELLVQQTDGGSGGDGGDGGGGDSGGDSPSVGPQDDQYSDLQTNDNDPNYQDPTGDA